MKFTEGGQGARRVWVVPDSVVQEYTYSLSGATADTATGGVQVNMVPKEGGNIFKGVFFGDLTSHAMTSDNLTSEIKARGVTSMNTVDKIWDVSPALGGPIQHDRIWFFFTYRRASRAHVPARRPGRLLSNCRTHI